MTISNSPMNNYLSTLKKCDFTNADFFYYLTLENQIWKVLDENVLDKEWVSDFHFRRLDNDFDEFMTDNRKKVFEFNFDQTEVWKELESRIEKGIGNKEYLEKVKNWNKILRNKKKELQDQDVTEKTKCPKCQSPNFALILWGLPDKKMIKEELKRKELVLGGCRVSDHDPKWHCNECKTRWGLSDNSKRIQFQAEKGIHKKEHSQIIQNKLVEKKNKKVKDSSRQEDKKIEEIPTRVWIKKELASMIGITLCGKCGTRTKLQYKESIEGKIGDEWIGYTICPKCGHKEKWLSGDRG